MAFRRVNMFVSVLKAVDGYSRSWLLGIFDTLLILRHYNTCTQMIVSKSWSINRVMIRNIPAKYGSNSPYYLKGGNAKLRRSGQSQPNSGTKMTPKIE